MHKANLAHLLAVMPTGGVPCNVPVLNRPLLVEGCSGCEAVVPVQSCIAPVHQLFIHSSVFGLSLM
jgi:hypothetical protein